MDLFWLAFKKTSRMRRWSSGFLRNTFCGGKQKNPCAKIGPNLAFVVVSLLYFEMVVGKHMSFMSGYVRGGEPSSCFFVLIFHDGGDPKQPLHGSKRNFFRLGLWWESSRGLMSLRILVDPFTAHDLQRLLELVRLHEERFGCAIFRLWRLKAPGQPWKTAWPMKFTYRFFGQFVSQINHMLKC